MIKAITMIASWIARGHDRFRNSTAGRRVFSGRVDHLHEQINMHAEHAELVLTRMNRVRPAKRPQWKPHEKLRILIFAERYALSQEKVAKMFGVTQGTISNWKRGLEKENNTLVQTKEPVNKLSDLIREVVHMIKRDFPEWGTPRIAGQLVKMAIKCARSSVRRILAEPRPRKRSERVFCKTSRIKATRPNQVFVVNFTTVKSLFKKIEIGAVIDSFTRKVKAIRVFILQIIYDRLGSSF